MIVLSKEKKHLAGGWCLRFQAHRRLSNWVLCNLSKKPLIASLARIFVPGTPLSLGIPTSFSLMFYAFLVEHEGSLLGRIVQFSVCNQSMRWTLVPERWEIDSLYGFFGLEGDPYVAPALG